MRSEGLAASRRGLILIFSSPSGAGKPTLTRMLLQDRALDLTLSISATTRARRKTEADGIHYRFIDRREFERMRRPATSSNGPKCTAIPTARRARRWKRCSAQGRDMLFDIDCQGAKQMRRAPRRGRRHRLHPAAVDERIARAPRAAGRGWRRSIAPRLENASHEIERWTPITTYVDGQRRPPARLSRRVAILIAERLRARRVEAGVEQLVDRLMRE